MNLARAQFLSLCTKGVTTLLGIAQSILVLRLLSRAEYGLVGLVMSIGGVIGVSQHLGVVDGAIREIAVLKDPKAIGKVFWVSHLMRQIVTIPLSLGLVLLAGTIATRVYGHPEITLYIQLFAGVLILQGLQDVLGATLTGLKKFVALYVVQIITAAVNIAVFGYLTWAYGIVGFFWSVIITTIIMIGLFIVLIRRYLPHALQLPTWEDVRQYGRRVMRIGAFMYLSRIFFVVWQRVPLLLLGTVVSADALGDVNVSLTFGSRLTIIAMALSEVNLAWMSALYAEERETFKSVVTRNMQRVLVVMMLITLVLLFFTPEIVYYVVGAQYAGAEHLIIVMTLAFFLYSLTDIGTSSVFVSADQPRLRMYLYGAMTAVTTLVVGYLTLYNPSPLLAGYAVLAGAAVAYVGMVVIAHRAFRISFLTHELAFFLFALAVSTAWFFTDPGFVPRSTVFVLLCAYISYEAWRSHLLPRNFGFFAAAKPVTHSPNFPVICFAGAAYHQPSWTNRQHIMSRVAATHRVLYVEPRIWLLRLLMRHWKEPRKISRFLQRVFWYEQVEENLFIKSQWNLLPLSREIAGIAQINHLLNRFSVLSLAKRLGFKSPETVIWLYDTEAAEYLSAFPKNFVLYDCVDDHASQAGVDRNSERVKVEEAAILQRANLVTVTSQRLLELKATANPNTHLVLNAGDVKRFTQVTVPPKPIALENIKGPILGLVGALDSYKIDFALLHATATAQPAWQFVCLGEPVVEQRSNELEQLAQLPNMHFLGAVPHRDVPQYVHHFEVCLIPYRNSRYNEASFPLKFWECMATGKPIVVTGLPALVQYQPLIGYAKSTAEFMDLVKKWLQTPTEKSAERISLAQAHSWEHRVAALLRLIDDQRVS